jgi:hypothetical protein
VAPAETAPILSSIHREHQQKLKQDVKIAKLWDGVPCEGKVVEIAKANSTLYTGKGGHGVQCALPQRNLPLITLSTTLRRIWRRRRSASCW